MKRSLLFLFLTAVIPSVLFAADAPGVYTKITSVKAKEMIDQGNVTVVDVRTPEEYNAGHLAGAVLAPLQTLEDNAPKVLKDKNATLLVYCRTGVRSANASKLLISMGYKHVYDIAGGITQWPYDIVKDAK